MKPRRLNKIKKLKKIYGDVRSIQNKIDKFNDTLGYRITNAMEPYHKGKREIIEDKKESNWDWSGNTISVARQIKYSTYDSYYTIHHLFGYSAEAFKIIFKEKDKFKRILTAIDDVNKRNIMRRIRTCLLKLKLNHKIPLSTNIFVNKPLHPIYKIPIINVEYKFDNYIVMDMPNDSHALDIFADEDIKDNEIKDFIIYEEIYPTILKVAERKLKIANKELSNWKTLDDFLTEVFCIYEFAKKI